MAFALPAIAIAGAAISAVGTLEQGFATQHAADYQAAVARNNAIIEGQNAVHAEQAGMARAQATSLRGAQVAGRIKAAQGASGIDVNTGSAVAVQESQREASKLDTETVLSDAELQAYGYRSRATSFTAQAGLDTAEGAQAVTGAEIGATGSFLSSAASTGFKFGSVPGGPVGPPLDILNT